MPKREQLRTFLWMYVCIKGETRDIHKGKSGLANLWPEPAFPGLKGTNDLVVWGGGGRALTLERDVQWPLQSKQAKVLFAAQS